MNFRRGEIVSTLVHYLVVPGFKMTPLLYTTGSTKEMAPVENCTRYRLGTLFLRTFKLLLFTGELLEFSYGAMYIGHTQVHV